MRFSPQIFQNQDWALRIANLFNACQKIMSRTFLLSQTKIEEHACARKWGQIFILDKSKFSYVQEFQELPRLNPRLEERKERNPKVTRHFFWPIEHSPRGSRRTTGKVAVQRRGRGVLACIILDNPPGNPAESLHASSSPLEHSRRLTPHNGSWD